MSKGTKLTHLLFADNSLLFCKETPYECGHIMDILECYEIALGQKVNKNKTTIFFSKSTIESTKHEIKIALGLQEIEQYEHYLGLPSLVGRRKKYSFNLIKEKVWRKLQNWEGKLLSQTGHEVLIKAVIQAISTFTMECFKIPLGLCHGIEALIKNFGEAKGERGRSIG